MIKWIRPLLIAGMLLLAAVPVFAQAPNAWYAVVYEPDTDSLHWINAQGEQGQISRPHLADEAAFLDLRIAPNGRTLVLAARLNSGLEALGIFDLAAGAFTATQPAQPGESISLGGENIFTANSQYFAVGFSSGDFANPAWRVILFNALTGNAASFIDQTHPDAPPAPLSAPSVQVIDDSFVHFQLLPRSVIGGASFPAFAWRVVGYDPMQPILSESPYTAANAQVQPLTGQAVVAYSNPNFASIGAGVNAIGAGILTTGTPLTPIHVDPSRNHLMARWAGRGDWVLFLSEDAQGQRNWNIVAAQSTGSNAPLPFSPDFLNAYGTADGYLLTTNTHLLYFSPTFDGTAMTNIAQLTPNSRVVYVTPIGETFSLTPIPNTSPDPGAQTVIAPPAPLTVAPPALPTPSVTACAATLPTRVGVGGMGRVLSGTLNVRSQPSGALLTSFSGGTTFYVTGGLVCAQDLIWWQIERFGTVGWVAESVGGAYLIEPYAGPMSADPTDTPPPAELPPPAPVCGSALPSRLGVGGSATVQVSELRPANGPGGAIIAQRFYLSGVQVAVNAGPECAGGEWWWLVTGSARVGRIGQNFEAVQGWVAETSTNSYNLSP